MRDVVLGMFMGLGIAAVCAVLVVENPGPTTISWCKHQLEKDDE